MLLRVSQMADDLPQVADPAQMAAARARNARLRIEGTRNLMAAAAAAGVPRAVAQSIAFAYAPGPLPHREEDPLDLANEGNRVTVVVKSTDVMISK